MSAVPKPRPDMNREEARATVDTIRRGLDDIRYLVLELHDRRGWAALGYDSWRSCVVTEFKQSESYLYRQLQAALIEQEISPMGETAPIPERQLRPLSVVPKEQQRETWEEAKATAPGGKVTAKHVRETVDRKIGKPAAKPEPTPAAEPEATGGQSRVNGVLVADPPDIAEARAAGRIGADVVPEITDPVATAEPEGDLEPDMGQDDLSNEEWLASLPLSEKLTGSCLKAFQMDALYYRHLESTRKKVQYHAARAPHANRQSGPYAYRTKRWLKTDHPKHWLICPTPDNGGCGGTGQVDLIGQCPKCRGKGFWIK